MNAHETGVGLVSSRRHTSVISDTMAICRDHGIRTRTIHLLPSGEAYEQPVQKQTSHRNVSLCACQFKNWTDLGGSMITNNFESMSLFKGPLNKCQELLVGRPKPEEDVIFSHRCEWMIAMRAISCWQLLQRRASLRGGSTFKKSIGSEKIAARTASSS